DVALRLAAAVAGEGDANRRKVELRDGDVVAAADEALGGLDHVGVGDVRLGDIRVSRGVLVAQPVRDTIDAEAGHGLVEMHLAAPAEGEAGGEGVQTIRIALVVRADAVDAAGGGEMEVVDVS